MAGLPRLRPLRPPAPASTSAPSITSASKLSQQPASLSKRLLFPHQSPNADLPPLLTTPSVPPELTHELYEIIAFSLRAYVHPWWSKITRYDKELLPEITRILTVVLRALEARVLAVDLSPLIFRDIPTLIVQHYKDYRNAEAKLSTSYAAGGVACLPQLFHQFQPHMALSAEGKVDEEYFRQIVDHVLKSCLAPEDYDAEAERFIIREIVVKMLLKDIIPKVSQPWYLHSLLLDLIGAEEGATSLPEDSAQPDVITRPSSPPPSSFSFHTLLVAFLSAIQTISGACLAIIHAYKQTLVTIKSVKQAPAISHPTVPSRNPQSVTSRRSASLPSPLPHVPTPTFSPDRISSSSSVSSVSSSRHSHQSTAPDQFYGTLPSLAYPPINNLSRLPLIMISEVLMTHERFASATIMNTLLMLSSSIVPFLDRLLLHLLTTALSTSFITQTMRTAKRNLFPNGYAATPPPDPSPEEQAVIRERLVRWKPHGVLAHLLPLILGHHQEVTLGAALNPLSSVPCNVHFAVLIFDRLTLALFPELGIEPSSS